VADVFWSVPGQPASEEPRYSLVYGPQTVRRYRRDTGSADAPVGATGDATALDALGTGELDLIVRGLMRRVGAQAGLLAVSDETGEVVEVLGTWGSVLGLSDLPASLIDGFVGRAFAFERAALEPILR